LTAKFLQDETSMTDQEIPVVSIYPNPTATQFTITSDARMHTIVITDIRGSVVKRIDLNDFETTLSASYLKRGLYIVNVYTLEGMFAGKMEIHN